MSALTPRPGPHIQQLVVPPRSVAPVRDLSFPHRLAEIRDDLEAAGWLCDQQDAHPTWPRASVAAEHPSGARFFLSMRWSSSATATGFRKWSKNGRRDWFSPPPKGDLRSAWYSIKQADQRIMLITDPYSELPPGVHSVGFLPRQETGCRCEKIKLRGEGRAQEELQRALDEGRKERRYYQCPEDAIYFHLTSLAKVPRRLQRS